MRWMRAKKLKFNQNKTEVLLVNGRAPRGLMSKPLLRGVALPLNKQVFSLGVLLDSIDGGSSLLHEHLLSALADTMAIALP